MIDFDILVLIFWVTIIFYIIGENKKTWSALMVFWCLITSIHCYYHKTTEDTFLWAFNALLWVNSYWRKIKAERDEKKKRGDE